MRLVKCVEKIECNSAFTIGTNYLMDENSIWKDCDGDEYAVIYDEFGNRLGQFRTSHFVPIQ